MKKTYTKEFSMSGNPIVSGCDELEDVIINRHEKCATTAEYKEVYGEFQKYIEMIEGLLPDGREITIGLESAVAALEGICYRTAYKDGVSDLMSAMTFNRLGITNVEFPDLSSEIA